MNANERVERIFSQAVEIESLSHRAAFLQGACGDDVVLRRRVEQLIRAHESAGGFLKPNTAAAEAFAAPPSSGSAREPAEAAAANLPTRIAAPLTDGPGTVIGRYKILEQVGEGGFGVVYVAEQREPVKRRVALKIIKLGMDTRQVVARFEAERQALALMDHPNIAKVLDAGSTERPLTPSLSPAGGEGARRAGEGVADASPLSAGRPYFVMELVRGIRITDYCDQNNLPTRERLDLFIQVCQAIQHAHQKGIIHRDIKPSNILVTLHDGVPVPKVIDFGIAKATQQELTEKTVYTQLQQFVGTPAYMSPEQAEMSGLDIDTRSDIYSLGVLLYELLTGKTPFDAKELMDAGLDEMRRTIREREPVRPSTRIDTLKAEERTTTAQRRGLDAARLISLLRGDLDWIVMKCLEKDRTRRYETANGLAMDLKRHLDHEPVVARPPSTAYRFQKLVRRNKVAFAAASAVLLALLCGLALATVGLIRERVARADADARRLEADTARKAESDQRKRVEQARADEASQRQLAEANAAKAEANERHSQRLLYAADMNLAQQALQLNNLGRARRLLDRHRPAAGEEDQRGWEWRYLWQQCQSDALAMLAKRPARGFSVSFSPDGNRLAAGYWDGRVELWDVPRRVLLKVLNSEERQNPAAHVAFSPRTNLLVATAGRGVLKLHDLATGRDSVLWQAQGRAVRDLSFSQDGGRVVAYTYGGEAPSVVVIDVSQGLVLSTNTATGATVHMGVARLSADHRRLYIGNANQQTRQLTIQCLNHESGQQIWKADAGLDYGMTAMALSPDEGILVTGNGYEDPTIRVWDAASGMLLTKLEGHTGWISELTFSRDGRLLASVAADQSIRLWDTSAWTEIMVFRGHGDEVHAVAFTPDGRLLASGGKDGAIMLWDVAARQTTRGHRMLPATAQYACEIAPGTALTFNMQEMQVAILHLNDLTEAKVQSTAFGFEQLSFFSPPNIFGVHDKTNSLRIYEVQSLTPQPLGEIAACTNLVPGGAVYCRAKRLVAWSGGSNAVHVASLSEPARRVDLDSKLNEVIPVEFSPDGRLLVLVGLGGRNLEIWDVDGGNVVAKLEVGWFRRPPIVFANEGRTFATVIQGASGNEVAFCDVTRPEMKPIRFTERGTLSGLTASPDGRLVAVCSQDGFVVLYDAQSMARKNVLHGHMQGVHGVRFSPDGKSLVSSSGAREALKIWHVETGQELLTLRGKGSLLSEVEFVDGGNALLAGSAGQNGTWQIWRAPSWEEIDAAEKAKK
jgi:serine/threonine protein kinase/WD40 repeat protein